MTAGAGIPVHRPLNLDEAFYVLEGSGTLTLNDVPHSFEKGGVIFIPKNTWHGFANPSDELLVLWIVTPAGLDGFFSENCNPHGIPPKQLSRGATQPDCPQIRDGIQIVLHPIRPPME